MFEAVDSAVGLSSHEVVGLEGLEPPKERVLSAQAVPFAMIPQAHKIVSVARLELAKASGLSRRAVPFALSPHGQETGAQSGFPPDCSNPISD